MSKPKTKHPLASFDPALFDLLRQGATREIKIPCGDAKTAIYAQHRIHSLRSAMRKEGHPESDQFYRTEVTFDRTDPTILVVRPRDTRLRDLIKATGEVKLTEEGAPPLPLAQEPNDTSVSLDELFRGLKE